MKSTFRILFYVKKDKKRADGTYPIMCRITIDGEPSRFNTKVSVNPTIWDAKAGVAIGKSNEAIEVNALLKYGKNGKIDPLKTVESDHLKLCLQKGKKLSVGNGV